MIITDFKTRFWLFTILIFASFSGNIYAQDSTAFNPKDAKYLWPTNASHALSGGFAETRSGHFHAALDIKTWGRRGYPVYATRSGTLYRMAIGPTGYGKVLYLKHDDGSYSLYAHLLRFNKQLQQLADSIRFSDYSPSFDMVVDTMNIHFEQGEQIALSGASGIGPPHLHFELRTPNEEPFNPLLTNLKIKDHIAPSFSGLAVIPLEVTSKIEGQNRIYTRKPKRRGHYTDFGTIDVSGPVGLAGDLFDQANGVPNVYAVYKTTLRVDGRKVFHSQANQFSYDETDQIYLDRVYPLLQSSGRGFQRLYVEDGNTLSFYDSYGNGGRLNLSSGEHKIVIQANDFNGNKRQAQLTLDVHKSTPEPKIYTNAVSNNKSGQIDPNAWSWFNDWVNIPNEDFYQLTLTPLVVSTATPIYYDNGSSVSVSLTKSPQFYFRTSSTDFFIARRVDPDSPAYLLSGDDRTYASFPANTFYDATSVAITKKEPAPDSIEIQLFPNSTPLRKSYNLSVRLDSAQLTDTTLSYYKTYPHSRYLRKLNTRRNGNYLTASPSSLARFLILSDHKKPDIGSPRIVKSRDNKWLIYIPAFDRRSGIDYKATKIYVNGVRGLTEWEPEDGRLVYYHPDFQPESSNHVKIIAYDKAGNRTEKEADISR